MSKYTFLFIIFSLFFSVSSAKAQSDLLITEIMYDLQGSDTDQSGISKEWIEIYNYSLEPIDITDWKFIDSNGPHGLNAPPINGGQGSMLLQPNQYAILTGNASLFLANHPSFTGTLIDTVMYIKNISDSLSLRDEAASTVVSVSFSSSLGANGNGKTLELNSQGVWFEGLFDGGTPGEENSIWQQNPQPPPPPPAEPPPPPPQPDEPPPSSTEIPSAPETTPDNTQTTQEPLPSEQQEPPAKIEVYLSELIPNPLGADSDLEFIEIVNLGDSVVDLSGWTITDPTKIFVIGTDILLEPKKYLVFYAHETHINLNNDGDTIKFFDKNNELKDAIQYGKTKEGFSLVKIDGSWLWTQEATPGEKNKLSASSDMPGTETQTIEPNAVAIATAPDINEDVSAVKTEKSVPANNNADSFFGQDDNEQINQLKAQSSTWLKSKNFLVLSLALLLGFLGGFAVFIIRKKLRA